jgi:hypothetical protein
VSVLMVKIGKVRVPMNQGRMPVPVRMWLTRRSARIVSVLVMRVVRMPMLVLHRLVRVFMLVAFGQMHPKADRHEEARREQPARQRLIEQRQ